MPESIIARASDELLATCDNEPIHVPEAIQPHGALLVLNLDTERFERASKNTLEFIGVAPEEILNTCFEKLFASNEEYCNALQELSQTSKVNRRAIQLPGPFQSLICEAHRTTDGLCVLELEQPSETPPRGLLSEHSTAGLSFLRHITSKNSSNAGLKHTLQCTADCVREITEYDRVMVYQLDKSGHGSVVAESKIESIEPFQGMHFPSTDIPKQARRLYITNRVRLLSNVNYAPIGLFPAGSSAVDENGPPPLDMSLCHLRSVSPVHVEYLQNMGVVATLVISIVIDDQLWGMLACHHYGPKHIDARMRNQCEQLAHTISISIQAEEQRELRNSAEASQELLSTLEERIGSDVNWLSRFIEEGEFLLSQMNANGAVLLSEGEQYRIGNVPYSGVVEKIRRHILDKAPGDTISVESLASENEAFASIGSDYCGCLMTIISHQPGIQMLWFRKEQRQTIHWSGDPTKSMVRDRSGVRLSPRKSFEKWCQVVDGRSLPWTLQDRFRAKAISQFVSSRKVEDASRQKSLFLATMSHEIRTPMAAIVGYVDVLCEENEAASPSPVFSEALGTIRRNGDQLLKVIDDILDLSQIEAGRLAVSRSDCSPGDILKKIEPTFFGTAKRNSLSFELKAIQQIPKTIFTDSNRLEQILHNLISNAIKFTSRGHISIEVNFSIENPASIEFRISDTGCGIQPVNVGKLFKPFAQEDNSLTRVHGGTGLGLVISKQLAKLLGGDLQLSSSTPGIGSTFSLRIATGIKSKPELEDLISPDGQKRSSNESDASPLPLLDFEILLAEDGLDNQRLITLLLRKAGAKVVLAENGQLAIDQMRSASLEKRNFDIVLMDMQMPVLDGYRATSQLRDMGFDVPVIALTAHAMTGDRERCLEAGCDDYITKPVDRSLLINTIYSHVTNHRGHNQLSHQI